MRFRLIATLALAISCQAVLALPVSLVASPPALADPQVSDLAVKAAKLALAGKFVEAGAAAEQSHDQAAIKLVELIYLRDHPNDAGYGRIMDFVNSAPLWPLTDSLIKRAERTLYYNNEPKELILAHFAKRKPVTDEGALALARAKLATGDRDGAATLVRQVWSDPDLDPKLETAVASEFKSFLTLDSHKARMWRLIYAQESNGAIRASRRLSGEYRQAAKVAQALLKGSSGADKQYARLPAAMRGELAMKYALVRYYRRFDRWDSARKLLVGIPADPAFTQDPDAWWVERRIVVRHSIGPTHKDGVKDAYQIARSHGFTTGEGAIEGEFLAGWIALRSLKDPGKALGHFQKLAQIADNRTEKARAKYWLGRTYSAMHRSGDATSAYREAAQYSTVYYGELAREEIGQGRVPEDITSGDASPAARALVDKDEVVRAFKMVSDAGSQKDLYMFLWAMAQRFDTVDQMNAAANVAWTEGGATMAVRLAKAAAQRNIDIDSWSYPVKALPDWKEIGKPIEKSLVFALSRQESEFNPAAGSAVGAQGLMQIMPGTAKLIARRYGLSYRKSMLTGDPAYNVKLGAAHLGDLIDDFGGSYVLTLVAYNAGPRRSREWVAEYGDLRDGKTDPIDWVESIPFQETRQYVQKVLQNIHVYRSRLAPSTVRPMTADLKRGAVNTITVADSAEDTAASRPSCKGGSIADLISACE
jgi:soluble lytic murein transglycosylase